MANRLLTAVLFGFGVAILAAAVWKGGLANLGAEPQAKAPVQELRLEVADTPEKRARGLEGVKYLPENSGMLFVFENAAIQCMWNKPIPFKVKVLFFTEAMVLINSEVMEARSEKKVCSTTPAKYAIEVSG